MVVLSHLNEVLCSGIRVLPAEDLAGDDWCPENGSFGQDIKGRSCACSKMRMCSF